MRLMPSFTFPKFMFATQQLSLGSANEKLGTIHAYPRVYHEQNARTHMLQDEGLIPKFPPLDGLAASTILVCKVAILSYESRNNSVNGEIFISKSFLSSTRSTKVSFCLQIYV